jgi:transposase
MTELFQNALVGAIRRIEDYIKNGGDEMLAKLVDDPDEFLKKYLKLRERTEKLRMQLEKQK